MRQVIVKKDELLVEESFTEFTLRSEKPLDLKPGATWVELRWPINPMTSGELRFAFSATTDLALSGVMLAGHYRKGDQIALVLYNLGANPVHLPEKAALAAAWAYEPVQMRQVTQEFKDVMVLNSAANVLPAAKPKKKSSRSGTKVS
jgi:hypothetical protein